jgi:hypothetical protein
MGGPPVVIIAATVRLACELKGKPASIFNKMNLTAGIIVIF